MLSHEDVCLLLGFEIDKDWTIQEIFRFSELAGFALIKDNEIHCWRHPEFDGIWLTKHTIQKVIQPLIDNYGCVVTKVRNVNNTGHKFVTRLGFKKVSENDYYTDYRIERLTHA